jgi:hypothetical protein
LRIMKRFAHRALAELSPTFDAMYGNYSGRPSIATGAAAESVAADQLVLRPQRASIL